jgi:hypothetical protein
MYAPEMSCHSSGMTVKIRGIKPQGRGLPALYKTQKRTLCEISPKVGWNNNINKDTLQKIKNIIKWIRF